MARFDAADLDVRLKADATHVTEADLATERAIREILEAERPDDGVFGEEFGVTGSTERQWIIDPIDGTANYLKGIPMWTSLIALSIDGVPRVGVASQPALGRRWWAATGLGAWTNTPDGSPRSASRVSSVDSIGDSSASFQSIRQWDEVGQLDAARPPLARGLARPRLRRHLAVHAAGRGPPRVRRRVRRQGVRHRRPRADHHRGRRPVHVFRRQRLARRSAPLSPPTACCTPHSSTCCTPAEPSESAR